MKVEKGYVHLTQKLLTHYKTQIEGNVGWGKCIGCGRSGGGKRDSQGSGKSAKIGKD